MLARDADPLRPPVRARSLLSLAIGSLLRHPNPVLEYALDVALAR
jgi:hypothetical protein